MAFSMSFLLTSVAGRANAGKNIDLSNRSIEPKNSDVGAAFMKEVVA